MNAGKKLIVKTADELVAEGHRLRDAGNLVPILLPSQEWLALRTQSPFIRAMMDIPLTLSKYNPGDAKARRQ